MGRRLNWDFGDVRVHEGARADAGSRSGGALAYTVGNHVVFSNERRGDRSLLAHELPHVVQQSDMQAPAAAAPVIVEADSGTLEKDAERTATAVLAGAPRPRPSHRAVGLQREVSQDRILGPEELAEKGWQELIPFKASEKVLAQRTFDFLASTYPRIKVSIVFVVSDYLYGFTAGDLDHPKKWQLTGKGSLPAPGVIVGSALGQERAYVKGPDNNQEFYLTPVGFYKREHVELTTSSTITVAEEVDFLRRGNVVWVRPAAESPSGGAKAAGGKRAPVQTGAEDKQQKKDQAQPKPHPRTANEYEGGTGQAATDPGWPAHMTGPDLQPTGGSGTYNMVLDWSMLGTQADLLSMVTNQMAPITYFWEYFNITEVSKKGLTAEKAQSMRREAVSPENLVGPGGLIARDAERRAEDLAEDATTSAESMVRLRPGETAVEAVGRIGLEYDNLVLLPASALVSAGGLLIDTFSHLLSAWSNEQEIPWPKTPGVYMVRCIASPEAQGDRRRAPSFAIRVVEVRPTEWIARNTLGAAEADIEELRAAIRLEQDPKLKADLERRLADAEVGAHGSGLDALRLALTRKQASVDVATNDKARQEAERDALKKQLARAEGRSAEFANKVYRPRAAFASDVTGLSYPLILQLGRLSNDGKRIRWMLSDDSAKEGGTYTQAAYNDEDAIWKAFEDFAGGNGFGRGQLAVELPPDIPNIKTRTKVIRNKDTGFALLKSRLNDLVTILVALSLFIPGVGEVAAVIGGALAAERLWERYKKGTLDFTDPATIGDVIAVLAAAATTLGAIGKLRMANAQGRFALLGENATEADVLAAKGALADAAAFVRGSAVFGQIVNYGGFIWGEISTLETLVKINQQEQEGTITHSEARKMRADAILSGLQNNLLFIHGLREAQKAQAEAEGLPNEEVGRKRPPGVEKGKAGAGGEAQTGVPQGGPPEVTAQGAVRGAKNYKLSGSTQVKSGEPSLETGVDRAVGQPRPGVTVTRATPPTAGTASTFEMTVKTSAGPVVKVKITIEASGSLGGKASHGVESGPARVTLQRGAAGWEAKVVIRDRVYQADVHLIAGHEFNEIAAILRDFPNATQAEVDAQMDAAVFKPGGGGRPTAHDQAAALELSDFYAELQAARKGGNKDAVAAQQARIDRMLKSMGLDPEDPSVVGEPAAVKERLDRLRALGLPAELDASLRPKVEWRAFKHQFPSRAALTSERLGHILYPESPPKTVIEFQKAGVGGGHLDSELMRFQTDNPGFHFELVKTKPMGTATASKYEQYMYAPGGKAGVPPPGAEWGGPSFTKADWKVSTQYKTTISDSTILIDEGSSAWESYPKPATPAGQVVWTGPSASGFTFSGYSAPDPTTGGWRITTVYPEHTWF